MPSAKDNVKSNPATTAFVVNLAAILLRSTATRAWDNRSLCTTAKMISGRLQSMCVNTMDDGQLVAAFEEWYNDMEYSDRLIMDSLLRSGGL